MNDHDAPTPIGLIAIYAAIAGLALVVAGASFAIEGAAHLFVAGTVALVITLALFPVAWYARRAATRDDGGLDEVLGRLNATIRELGEQQALSDDARRVINRRRERELLRRAIEEDVAARDWDAAATLVKELAERFGYRADAEEFRRKIDHARSQTVDQEFGDAVRRLDALIIRAQWHEAADEAERLTRLFPDHPRAEGLRHRVADARDRYKAELERRFLHAAEAERVEEAMDLLKQLDHYLTEEEAAPYLELARGVVGKARENLGVQFKLAVQDRDWPRAVSLGEAIIKDFPNTRMAAEVRQLIDSLRDKAANAHAAAGA